jgi:spore maturation protein CgeB
MRFVVLGLSLTSSWGNGHATTYRALLRALGARGHEILFLERDLPFYAANRDLPAPDFARLELYTGLADLTRRFAGEIRAADFVIVGSYVPDGIAVGDWVLQTATGPVAFYDIDTPVTLEKIASRGSADYIDRELIGRYALYLSFSGGPTLRRLEQEFGSPRARALYCSVDPNLYHPTQIERRWSLGYLGTYSPDRQPALDVLLLEPAHLAPDLRMVVAGPQYPETIAWPANVERIDHLPPAGHVGFYNQQTFTLNITRRAMLDAGHSPSVRVFEAAACGIAIITDAWPGLEDFFVPGEEILVAKTTEDALDYLRVIGPEAARQIGARGRARVLAEHTASHRAAQLETYALELIATPQQRENHPA